MRPGREGLNLEEDRLSRVRRRVEGAFEASDPVEEAADSGAVPGIIG